MITRVTGTLERVLESEVRLVVGDLEYQVLVPELVRRQVQTKIGERVALHTLEFLEGDAARGGRLTPRLVGFLSEPEIEFFELFCTVDGIGVRKALKAMVRSVRDVADMIHRQDVSMLATLPGIGASAGERVIAKLRKKVAKFALMVERDRPAATESAEPGVVEETFLALVSVGHSEVDARRMLDKAMAGKRNFKTSADLLSAIYEPS